MKSRFTGSVVLVLLVAAATIGWITWFGGGPGGDRDSGTGVHDQHDGHDHDGHDHEAGTGAGKGTVAAADQDVDVTVACGEHGLARCPFCHPELLVSMGFCESHGVPEALCSRCRGDLEPAFRARNDWCGGHGLPESQCELCNPGTLDQFARYRPAEQPLEQDDTGAELVRSDQPRIQRAPELDCATENSIVRFPSAEVVAKVGLGFAEVREAPLRRMLEVPAELRYDARRHALLAPRASGNVVEVCKDLGDPVEAGEVLLVIHSAELGTAKSALLQAQARVHLWETNFEREQRLLESGLTTEKDLLEAETELAESKIARSAAEQRLRNLGLDENGIRAVRDEQDSSSRLPLVAPFTGKVVDLRAVVGQLADTRTTLVGVADTSRLWAIAEVDQGEVAAVAVGQSVLLTIDGLRGETFGGRVTWVSTEVDPRTRTVEVRVELANAEGRLRANSYGRARIVTRDGEDAVLVPKAAVQWEGCCNVAFVRRHATEFAPHKLRLGYDTGEHYEVLSGLEPGQVVVTQGSFLLKTELMKGSIGAGCCEVDHLGK